MKERHLGFALIASMWLAFTILALATDGPKTAPVQESSTVMFRVREIGKDKKGLPLITLQPVLAVDLAAAPLHKDLPNKGDVLTCVTSTRKIGVVKDTQESGTSSLLTLDCGKELKLFILGIEFQKG